MDNGNNIKQNNHSNKKIVVFASGAGSNAAKIIDYFRGTNKIVVSLVVCNKPGAGVIEIAASHNIPVLLIEKEQFFRGDGYVAELERRETDLIVLAGFLWKIPEKIIQRYRNRIINIHPALLPKFGGKGMYGSKVHEAVVASGETESGITIHYVDEHYDNGDVIFQAKCKVEADDTATTLAEKIHRLEHKYFAKIIEECVGKIENPSLG